MSFHQSTSRQDGITLVHVQGRIDSATAAAFETTVQGLFATPGERVLMDFDGLDYISSAGLRVVLMAAKRSRTAQGRLLLCGMPAQVREVFEISGFLKILDTVADRAAALQQLAQA